MAQKSGKNVVKARAQVDARSYTLVDAVTLLQKIKFAKFDETVDVTLRLGVDPKHADQMVRGTVVLPHGLGKKKIVLNLAKVDYIDSSGMGELVSSFTTVRNSGGELKLLSLTKKVRDVVQVTKLYTIFDIKDDEFTAIKSFDYFFAK